MGDGVKLGLRAFVRPLLNHWTTGLIHSLLSPNLRIQEYISKLQNRHRRPSGLTSILTVESGSQLILVSNLGIAFPRTSWTCLPIVSPSHLLEVLHALSLFASTMYPCLCVYHCILLSPS